MIQICNVNFELKIKGEQNVNGMRIYEMDEMRLLQKQLEMTDNGKHILNPQYMSNTFAKTNPKKLSCAVNIKHFLKIQLNFQQKTAKCIKENVLWESETSKSPSFVS